MTLKTIIIENELNAQCLLSKILNDYCTDIQYNGAAATKQEAVKLINTVKPEVVFMDIELDDGSGFEVLDQVEYTDFKLIFTTAYDEYAVKAFKYEAIDYVLKPYSPKDILSSVQRAKKIKNGDHVFKRLDNLLKTNKKESQNKISITTTEGISILKINDIIRIEADRSYSHIYLSHNRKMMVSKPLKEFETKLPASQFFRTHTSHLVNLKSIIKYSKEDGGYAVTSDQFKIPISRRRKQDFLDAIRF